MLAWSAAFLLVVLVAGGVTAYQTGRLDDVLGRPKAVDSVTAPVPGFVAPTGPAPVPVAPTATSPRPSGKAVRRALAKALADPHLASLRAVVAPLTGRPVLDVGHGTSMPASTLKLLTTTAALQALGPDRTFATRVMAEGRKTIVLVGGGDPYLETKQPRTGPYAHDASLQALATRTAKALHAEGVPQVALRYDVSLFSGPRLSPHWPRGYVTGLDVSPITALWADEGMTPNGLGEMADPAASAAQDFAAFLHHDGVQVTGSVRQTTAGSHAREIARVTSQPLADIVERVLQNSDNNGAEVLGHQVGLAVAGDGSFAGGVTGVRTTLHRLGIDLGPATFTDASGLSRHDRVDAETLVQVLQLDASPDHPQLRSVVSGLPVAAYDGTLVDRFGGSPGRGLVRAKTGTLTGTDALAGIAADAHGHALLFAFVSNHVRYAETLDTRAALDDLAASLALCPC